MKLKIVEALRVDMQNAIAIVGAGGKTSLMFALAEAAGKPVCLTTTTKLAREEGLWLENHFLLSENNTQIVDALQRGENTLVTNGLNASGEKWLGLSAPEISTLQDICQQVGALMLIEADGARRLSLKAPGEQEPVIPGFVSQVIVVVGLSAIGKPLDEQHVFRSERFSSLTGLPLGEPVSLVDILKMLTHPEGGLKGVPPDSETVVVFNQADTYDVHPNELDLIGEALGEKFSSTLITSLRTDPENCEVIFRR